MKFAEIGVNHFPACGKTNKAALLVVLNNLVYDSPASLHLFHFCLPFLSARKQQKEAGYGKAGGDRCSASKKLPVAAWQNQ